MGDISYCNKDWDSRVEKIRVYDKNVFRKELLHGDRKICVSE